MTRRMFLTQPVAVAVATELAAVRRTRHRVFRVTSPTGDPVWAVEPKREETRHVDEVPC